MDQIKQPSGDSNLHWFWKLATQWWFFPVFCLIIVFVLSIYLNLKDIFDYPPEFFDFMLSSLAILPMGLVSYFVATLDINYILGYFLMALSYLFFIISLILIPYYKIKKNKVNKVLIIALFWLIIVTIIILFYDITHPIYWL